MSEQPESPSPRSSRSFSESIQDEDSLVPMSDSPPDSDEDPLGDLERAAEQSVGDDASLQASESGFYETVQVAEHDDDLHADMTKNSSSVNSKQAKSVKDANAKKTGRRNDSAPQEKQVLPADYSTLAFKDYGQALRWGRKRLIFEEDDVDLMESERENCVIALKRAMVGDYERAAEKVPKDKDGDQAQAEWLGWQENAVKLFNGKVQDGKTGSDQVEVACWKIFNAVLAVHREGRREVPRSFNRTKCLDLDDEMICSERLKLITNCVERFPLIRIDLLDDSNIDMLAATPRGCVQRKIANCWNNTRRAKLEQIRKNLAAPDAEAVRDDTEELAQRELAQEMPSSAAGETGNDGHENVIKEGRES